ncbi:MAG: HD domain-containing protein [Candidatus Asgardarchaeia archaeon]
MSKDEIEKIFEIITLAGTLKRVPRYGWLMAKVPKCDVESVAEHSYRVSLISMFIAEYMKKQGIKVDSEKVIKMALIHDIAEAKLQDLNLTSIKYLGEDVKLSAERRIIEDIFANTSYNNLMNLWNEFEQKATVESKIVKSADLLDMLFQALFYEEMGVKAENLNEFWSDLKTLKESEIPIVRKLAELLEHKRDAIRR